MSNEARVSSSLTIRTGNLTYQSQPTSFTTNVAGVGGPTPGMITADTDGTNVDFSALVNLGLCRIQNLDETNFVTVGLYDGSNFLALMDFMPGESFIFRLSQYLGTEFAGTGTGTTATPIHLRIIADTTACKVIVEAFEN